MIQKILSSLSRTAYFWWSSLIFVVVLFIFTIQKLLKCLPFKKLFRWDISVRALERLIRVFDYDRRDGVSRSFIIELAFRNMKSKKNRAVVTIGGVAVGVAAIVFLVSLGYGLEKMVIGRVAGLQELKMADITTGKTGLLKINGEVMDKITKFTGVKEVVPVVSLVSKVKFNNSVLDIMAVGVDGRYIKLITPKFLYGEKLTAEGPASWDKVATRSASAVLGVSQELVKASNGERIGEDLVNVNVAEGKSVSVWKECTIGSELVGVIIRQESAYLGEKVWGDEYIDTDNTASVGIDQNGRLLSVWVRAKVPLWSENEKEK